MGKKCDLCDFIVILLYQMVQDWIITETADVLGFFTHITNS